MSYSLTSLQDTSFPSPLPQVIGARVRYAVQSGMKIIACIGEKLSERENGQTDAVVCKQLKAITGKQRDMQRVGRKL